MGMALPNKRSVMTLYSDSQSIDSHRVRLVLAEKGITVDVIHVDPNHLPDDLLELNPYATLPTMVDRDLVLYDTKTIIEYLDERFPHPTLLPVYPVARAKYRLMVHRIEKDWYPLFDEVISGNKAAATSARNQLRDSLVALTAAFAEKSYFLSDDFSLIDCALAPLLWRLSSVGIKLPTKAQAITEYAERVFARPSFKASLSEDERDMESGAIAA